jgi:hypothetical protein
MTRRPDLTVSGAIHLEKTTFAARIRRARRQAVRELWKRGVARGEIRPELGPEWVIDLIFGLMFHRLLVGHGPLAAAAAVFGGLQVAPVSQIKRKRQRLSQERKALL